MADIDPCHQLTMSSRKSAYAGGYSLFEPSLFILFALLLSIFHTVHAAETRDVWQKLIDRVIDTPHPVHGQLLHYWQQEGILPAEPALPPPTRRATTRNCKDINDELVLYDFEENQTLDDMATLIASRRLCHKIVIF